MNIFLTGGTGFIGCHFINELTKNGHHVRALRRIYSQQRIPLHKSPEWIEGDLSKPNSDWFNGIDVLVHLASHTPNPPYAELAECIYWNVYAPLKVFELARSLGVTKFIAGGTMFEYGISSNAVEYLEVDTPLKPNNSYSTSKASASLAFEGFSREKNVSLKLLRFFQVYGEGERSDRFWPSLKRAALDGEDFFMSSGEQVRHFINVKELVNLLIDELNFDNVKPGIPLVKNLINDEPEKLIDFAKKWWVKLDAKGRIIEGSLDYRKNELMRIVVKNEKK